ncbi:hypothetical protein L7F22_028470 [Adiantum nelumboides]|nr:hypothetical protein [Adiantum nelumboides]
MVKAKEATTTTIKTIMIKIVQHEPHNWDEKLQTTLWAYRTAYRETTGMTPFRMVYGTEVAVPLEFAVPSLRMAKQYNMDFNMVLKARLEELQKLDEQRQRALLEQQVVQQRRKYWHDSRLRLKNLSKVSDCDKDSVFRFVAMFAIVLAGFGLRRVFASRLPNMAARTSEFELFVTRFDGSDFAWWSSHMLDALTCLGQALPLQGKDARPDSMSNSAWEDLDALARLTIMLSLVEQLEQSASSCETQLVVQGLCRSEDSSVVRQESSDTETMTCVDDRHDEALRSFTDMPLPMSDSLSHGTSCVDVIARETDACEPRMAMLIDTQSVDELDFREPEMDVLFYDASDMFEDDSVLQTFMYAHGELAMIADSASDLDILTRELLSIGVMSTGLAHEGIAHGGEQEVDTLLHVWLDATSGSDARTILGTGASLIEHDSSTRLSLL